MATAYVIWDRKAKQVVAPTPNGAFGSTQEADDVLHRLRRKSGPLGRNVQNLERTTVNID